MSSSNNSFYYNTLNELMHATSLNELYFLFVVHPHTMISSIVFSSMGHNFDIKKRKLTAEFLFFILFFFLYLFCSRVKLTAI